MQESKIFNNNDNNANNNNIIIITTEYLYISFNNIKTRSNLLIQPRRKLLLAFALKIVAVKNSKVCLTRHASTLKACLFTQKYRLSFRSSSLNKCCSVRLSRFSLKTSTRQPPRRACSCKHLESQDKVQCISFVRQTAQ